MKHRYALLFSLAPALAMSADFQLSDPSQIKDANAIQLSINAISAKVSQCIEKKLAEPARCFCLYPAEFDNFKKAYANAIAKHPEWKGKLVYFDGNNLNFVGLQRQNDMKCDK